MRSCPDEPIIRTMDRTRFHCWRKGHRPTSALYASKLLQPASIPISRPSTMHSSRTANHRGCRLIEEASEIVLLIHWIGGAHTDRRLPKLRRGQRNSTSGDIITAIRQLVLIASDDPTAGILNRNRLATGHGNRWTPERVTANSTRFRSAGPHRKGTNRVSI